MVIDSCKLLLLALQSVTELPPSTRQNEMLFYIYDSIPDSDRGDIISKVLDSCEENAALALYTAIPDIVYLDTDIIKRITYLVSAALSRGKISFLTVPDIFNPENMARDYILSIVYFILRDPMSLALYSDFFSAFLDNDTVLAKELPHVTIIHDIPPSIGLHLTEAATSALRVLEPAHLILVLAAWYSATRSSLLPSSICNGLETLCRQAFSTGLFDSINSEVSLTSCDLLLGLLSVILKYEGLDHVVGYLNPQIKTCRHLELIASLLSLAGCLLSSLLKNQVIGCKLICSFISMSAYIVGLGSSTAVKRIALFLKVVLPIYGVDAAFSTAFLMLLDSIESASSLHIVIPTFQRFGPQMLSYVDSANGASMASLEQSPILLLIYNFLHRAMTVALLPIRRFYLHILPLIAVGFVSTFKVPITFFRPLFMACSILPAISGLREQRFARSDNARKRIAQERSRSLHGLEEGKDHIGNQITSAPYQLFGNCVFLSPDTDYQAIPFEDRDIEGTFPLTDVFTSSISSAIDETLENIAIGYYALAKKYNNLCVGSPLVTDNTVYRAVVSQMLLQSVSCRQDPIASLSNLCIIIGAASAYTFPSILFIVINSAISVTEHCLSIYPDGLTASSDSNTVDGLDSLSSGVLESFKQLYCSVLGINRIHRPFFMTILFNLALSLSQLCNFMPSDIMINFMHQAFQVTTCPQNSAILTTWVALAEQGRLSALDILITLFLCILCKKPIPTLKQPIIDISSADESFYSLLSDIEHPSMMELFQRVPDYVAELVSLLHSGLSCTTVLKAALSTLRYGYRTRTPSDAMLTLHSDIWSIIAPDIPFLSPLIMKHIRNPDYRGLSFVLNNLSLEAVSYRLCSDIDEVNAFTDVASNLMDDWEAFSGTHTASFFGMLSDICLVCMKTMHRLRNNKTLVERLEQLTCKVCETIFQTVNNDVGGCTKGMYFHLTSKVLFSEHVIEVLWLLHISNSIHYRRLLLVVKRFFTAVYLFSLLSPVYSASILTPLVSSIHALIFNRVDTLLRSYFVKTELLDLILCLALYIPYDGTYYEVEDASSIIVQTGLIRYYEQVDKSECVSDTSFFADYRVRKAAIGLLQTLASHISPTGLMLSLLTRNMESSKEALDERRNNLLREKPLDIKKGKGRIDVLKLSDYMFNDVYILLFIPLLEPQKELSMLSSVSQLKHLTLLRIFRMLASITYHNKPYNVQSPESVETTLSNAISILSERLSLPCWTRHSREIWEQVLVLLIISSSRPLLTMQKTFPLMSLQKALTDKFTHLQSHLIITCNTIRIVLDKWIACALEQANNICHDKFTNIPDYPAYQMHLRELVPYTMSPVHSLRIIAQSFFLRMWSKGKLLTEAMRANNVSGHSFINKALLSVSVSSSLLNIFKMYLESTDVAKKYSSLLDLLDPRTEALCMTSAAAYVDTYYPTPDISAVVGNVVTTLDKAASEDTNCKKMITHALASLDLGPQGYEQLEDYTKHESMWTESYRPYDVLHEGNCQKKIHSTKKDGHKLVDQSSSLIINASLLDKTTNLGGLARTAEAFGLDSLVLGSASFALDPSFKAMSMTADMWLNIEEVRPYKLAQWIAEKRK
ncbi:TAR RNA loop binding protein, putative, partial [Giardia lamblia P15]